MIHESKEWFLMWICLGLVVNWWRVADIYLLGVGGWGMACAIGFIVVVISDDFKLYRTV